MSKELGQDLTTRIMELAVEKHRDTMKGTEAWITLKPKDLRRMIEDQKEVKQPEKEITAVEPISDDERKAIIDKIKAEADHSDRPETIGVEQPGKYDIDLKGLLEKEKKK